MNLASVDVAVPSAGTVVPTAQANGALVSAAAVALDSAVPRPSAAYRWVTVLGTLAVAGWALRWLPGAGLAPGADVTGHLQRIEAAWAMFGRGQLDGWFNGAMLGYQAHLFYGPGLAVAAGAVHLASLGALDAAASLTVVVASAYVATAGAVGRLGRVLGLSRWTAATAGILALACSSPRGGGIGGGFETALAAQQVAVPVLVLALSLVIEQVSPDSQSAPGPLALTVAALALTHPLSLVILGLLAPLAVLTAGIMGRIAVAHLGRLGLAGAWAAALTTCWWWPALTHRDLRGPVTSWDRPGLADHLDLAIDGARGLSGPVGPIAVLAVVAALTGGLLTGRRDLFALGLFPVAALAVLHAAHGVLGLPTLWACSCPIGVSSMSPWSPLCPRRAWWTRWSPDRPRLRGFSRPG